VEGRTTGGAPSECTSLLVTHRASLFAAAERTATAALARKQGVAGPRPVPSRTAGHRIRHSAGNWRRGSRPSNSSPRSSRRNAAGNSGSGADGPPSPRSWSCPRP
jgi:hypothetical protein